MRTKVIVALSLQLLTVAVANVASRIDEEPTNVEDFEAKLVSAMEEIDRKDNIDIFGNVVTLKKITEEDVIAPEEETDPLVGRIERFLRCRRLQINLPNDGSSADILGRALGQKDFDFELRGLTQGASEGRSKLKKILIPLLLAVKVKKMIVLPIIVTLIALIGIKGIGISFLSLLVSGATVLKALLTPPQPPRVTYGIAKPQDVYHEHWHRSQEEVNQPYRGWTPEYSGDQYPYPPYQDIP